MIIFLLIVLVDKYAKLGVNGKTLLISGILLTHSVLFWFYSGLIGKILKNIVKW